MAVRDFVYISERKIDLYFPQVERKLTSSGKLKGSLNAGVAKIEFEKDLSRDLSIFDKSDAIENVLAQTRAASDLSDVGNWSIIEINARVITNGGATFFCGRLLDDSDTIVVLCASFQYLIGPEYEKLKNEPPSFAARQSPVGRFGVEYFQQNSDSLGFARLLDDAFKFEKIASSTDFDFDSPKALAALGYGFDLSDPDYSLDTKNFFREYRSIIFGIDYQEVLDEFWKVRRDAGFFAAVYILAFYTLRGAYGIFDAKRVSLFGYLTNIIRLPLKRLTLGRDEHERRVKLVRKQHSLEEFNKSKLEKDEKKTLSAAYRVATSDLWGTENSFRAFAKLMSFGASDITGSARKVVLASPLYIERIQRRR